MLCCWNTNVKSHSPKQVMHLRKGEKNPSHNRRPRVKLKVAKDKSADLRLRRKRSSELEANMQNLEHRYKSDIMRLEKVRSACVIWWVIDVSGIQYFSQYILKFYVITYV